MPNEELLKYIRDELAQGRSEDVIRSLLASRGWHQQDVDDAFNTIKGSTSNSVHGPAAVQPAATTQPQTINVSAEGSFFAELFRRYRLIIWRMIGALLLMMVFQLVIVGIGLLAVIFSGVLFGIMGGGWLTFSAIIIGVVAAVIMDVWIQLAFTLYLFDLALHPDQHSPFWASLKLMLRKSGPFLWIGIISTVLLVGAFLLAIIPGIFFTIAFSLTLPVFLVEDKRGMDALLRSRDIVKGHWWYIFGMALVVIAITIIVPLIVVAISIGIIFLFHATWVVSLLNLVSILFIYPLSTILYAALYDKFQARAPSESSYPAGRQWRYTLLLLPILAAFIFLISGGAGILSRLPFFQQNLQSEQSVNQSEYQAELNAFLASSTISSTASGFSLSSSSDVNVPIQASSAPAATSVPTNNWVLGTVSEEVYDDSYNQIGTSCFSFRHPPGFEGVAPYDQEFVNASGSEIVANFTQSETMQDVEQSTLSAGFTEKDFMTSSGLGGKEFIRDDYEAFYIPAVALGKQILITIVPSENSNNAPLLDAGTMEAVAKSVIFPCSG